MELLEMAVTAVESSEISFCKFITPNDTGATGSHQSGFHVPKTAWSLFFDKPGEKGNNKDVYVTIKWQNDIELTNRVIYYGVGTRNEYRITRFGKKFRFLEEERIGDLLIICKKAPGYYYAYVLSTDDDIDSFFAELNLPSYCSNDIIPKAQAFSSESQLKACFDIILKGLTTDFPSTKELADESRNCHNNAFKVTSREICKNPDSQLLAWLKSEFDLFKVIENDRYSKLIKQGFKSVEELVETANSILNRRKSRAGKSLEHHLSEIFNINSLKFSEQQVTEDKKKPDFIFPSVNAYLDSKVARTKIIVLASKTTCKDRWRQVINEADSVPIKYLFTLQQGISGHQLKEMYKYGVRLVVPKPYLGSFPKEFQPKIISLKDFVRMAALNQSKSQ